jgi:hypothetical protein
VAALAMHPALRELLWLRIFWKPTHAWLLGSAAALLCRRPGLAALLLGRYALHYERLYGADAAAGLRAMPVHLAIDATEIATAVAGSVRYRTLML